ncbi:helix-turn-helix domain-containing protein [Zhouia sp. PK063]|uniref:helix-turn-helix domain-containing protein n=1 Tax=Zhouia sp. PK063 TaxID=3373602 RepID=UPI00379E1D0A
MATIQRIKSITEFHRLRNLPAPEHPLISIVDYKDIQRPKDIEQYNLVLDFYQISIKRGVNGKLKYGQQEYDFDEGIMFFIAPQQVFSIVNNPETNEKRSGWMLLIHPDFLWNTTLAQKMKQFNFFDYTVHEALFLSEKEEHIMMGIIENIKNEYHANIDNFSQQIVISQIETLLNYAERFYHRQFITRKITNHQILDRLEKLLASHFNAKNLSVKGIPSVQFIADELHVSASYLSNLLKVLTGKSTQQHIHEKVIDLAKEKLSTTNLSISEIAYDLGFEYPQTFSKLFKTKTKVSPLEFRQSFN